MECKICFEKYDTEDLKPIVCMPCGHSFCSICVVQLKDCSICRRSIKDKSPNYSLLEVLEEHSGPRRTQSAKPKSAKPKSNPEALRLKNEGMKLSEEKRFYDAVKKFEEALEVCTYDYNEKYSLLW
jgi:hypothetical protein